MTAGIEILKQISWPLKKKKSSLVGSGVSKEPERKKSSSAVKQGKISRNSSLEDPASPGNLEIVAPSTSGVEFKYSWPVDGFVKQVKDACRGEYDLYLTVCNLRLRHARRME
jgi:hypothetical protein